jgi:hypothetical protein
LGGALVLLLSNLSTIPWHKLKNSHIYNSAHTLELSRSTTFITHWHTKISIPINISRTDKNKHINPNPQPEFFISKTLFLGKMEAIERARLNKTQ